jgi:hypothetical protein
MKRHHVLAIAVALASAFTGFAVAAQPCGKAVIDDWYDNGTLDRAWDCECLGDAIDRLPGIRPPYSPAQDDLQRQIDVMLCEGGSSQQVLTATLAAPTGETEKEDSGDGWSFPLVVGLAIVMTIAVAWGAVRRRQREV